MKQSKTEGIFMKRGREGAIIDIFFLFKMKAALLRNFIEQGICPFDFELRREMNQLAFPS